MKSLRFEVSEDLELIRVYLPSGSIAEVSEEGVTVDGERVEYMTLNDCVTENDLVVFRTRDGIVAVEVSELVDEIHADLFEDWREFIRCVVSFEEECACIYGRDTVLKDIEMIAMMLGIPVIEAMYIAKEKMSEIVCKE